MKRKREEEKIHFTDKQLKVPIIEYLVGLRHPLSSDTVTVAELLDNIHDDLRKVTLQQVIKLVSIHLCFKMNPQ